MTDYDPDNIFARILRKEIPCHVVLEDDHILSFMDVMPQVRGHCLVIPKHPSRCLLDTDDQTLCHMIRVVQRVAGAALTAFSADGVQIRQYNGAAAGQTVFHLHFHVLPLRQGEQVQAHSGQMLDQNTLAEHANLLKQALDR